MAELSIIAAGILRYSSCLQFRPTFQNTDRDVSPRIIQSLWTNGFFRRLIAATCAYCHKTIPVFQERAWYKHFRDVKVLPRFARLPLIESWFLADGRWFPRTYSMQANTHIRSPFAKLIFLFSSIETLSCFTQEKFSCVPSLKCSSKKCTRIEVTIYLFSCRCIQLGLMIHSRRKLR